jgi:hypothetical protein
VRMREWLRRKKVDLRCCEVILTANEIATVKMTAEGQQCL